MNEVKKPKKPLIYYYGIVLVALLLFNFLAVPWLSQRQVKEVDYGTFMTMTEEKQVGRVEVQDNQILFTDKEEKQVYKTGLMTDPDLVNRLKASGAEFSSEIQEQMSPVLTFLLTWLVLRKWTDKEFVEPVPEVVAEIEETSSNDVKDILITGNDIPATFASFLTILIPVVLIAGSSFIKMVVAEASALYAWANIFGDKIVALGLGVIYTMLLAVFHKASVRKSNADATGKNPQSFREVVLNSWIARGLEIALPALLITGMGGAFAAVIQAAPAINDLAGLIEQSGVPGLLIPFLIGAIMFTAVGSMTTGGMTAAGVVGPMMVTLGLSPISTVLAIGAGTMIFNHVNNSGFWVISRFFNLDLKQGLKYITLPDFVAGIFCFVMICGAAAVGLF